MFHDQVLAHCRRRVSANITFTTSQWDLLLEMTAENQGVTLIGRPLVEKLYSGRIKCISLQNPEFLWTLGLLSKKCKTGFPALQRAFGIFAMKFEGDQTSQPAANLPAPSEKRRGQTAPHSPVPGVLEHSICEGLTSQARRAYSKSYINEGTPRLPFGRRGRSAGRARGTGEDIG